MSLDWAIYVPSKMRTKQKQKRMSRTWRRYVDSGKKPSENEMQSLIIDRTLEGQDHPIPFIM
jgi:hypothetical protein